MVVVVAAVVVVIVTVVAAMPAVVAAMSVAVLATAVVAVRNVLPVPRTWVVPVAVAVAGAIRRPRVPKWRLAIIGQNKPAMLVRVAIGKMIVR
ncbi:hypothetical protein D3C86_1179380 [compost metagenome]